MRDIDVKAVYDEVASDYADHFPSTEPEQRIELAMITHFASLLPETGRDVLDAGCGAGRMLPVLAGAGCHAVGVDLSESMIRRARQDHPDVDTRVGRPRRGRPSRPLTGRDRADPPSRDHRPRCRCPGLTSAP